MSRRDVEFQADGTTLRGWLYEPDGGPRPYPLVVMAHGFSATKEMYLDDFAEVFAAGGLGVLVYDNRNLGESDGEPRGEIDPWRQIEDYRSAVTFASGLGDVDADRIGIWGSSYSGAHVLVVAATDRRVRAVSSQVPLISGNENARRLVRADHIAGLRAAFDADRVARYQGAAPATIPVTWVDDPGEPCALPTADTHDFFLGPIRERAKTWENEVTLRSVEMFTNYEPGAYLPLISPTPLLLTVAAGDHLTPADLALAGYQQAREPKQLTILPGGHFEAYTGDNFAVSSAAQLDFFRTHLG
ncbi:alpha/beta hydrolase [Pseudonocardia kongjuensis]|uniref:Alpha/beta hydrolase n=1 Tax=Pseudonocardia kongjuensis TaxID=102227 RepID=A0ABN1XMJ2_9PSEU